MTGQIPPLLRRSATAVFATALLFACDAARADTPEILLERGNTQDLSLQAGPALETYLQLEKLQPQSADVKVRIARQYRHLMADAKSESEKRKLGAMALEYGRQAAKLDPSNSDAQLSCAISYAKMVPLQSSKEQVACSRMIKEGAERAIKLNANNDLAWHILGRWHRAVAGVSGVKRVLASIVYEKLPPATNEEAAKCLERAVKLNPSRMMHQIELGRTYAQMGRTGDARRHLQKGLSMPAREKEDHLLQADGRKLLSSLN